MEWMELRCARFLTDAVMPRPIKPNKRFRAAEIVADGPTDQAGCRGLQNAAVIEGAFGLYPPLECPLLADIVAKVENRTPPKISRKLIFRLPCRCNAL